MRKLPLYVNVAAVLVLLSGCASPEERKAETLFGSDQIPAVKSTDQLDKIVGDIPAHQGKPIRLAGRVLRVDSVEGGYTALARWLPYPSPRRVDKGPKDDQADDGPRFVISYRGIVKDRPYTSLGNKFVLEGTVNGTRKTVVDVFGTQKDLLHVDARCVRVWETGVSDIGGTPDSDIPLAVSRTFCVEE